MVFPTQEGRRLGGGGCVTHTARLERELAVTSSLKTALPPAVPSVWEGTLVSRLEQVRGRTEQGGEENPLPELWERSLLFLRSIWSMHALCVWQIPLAEWSEENERVPFDFKGDCETIKLCKVKNLKVQAKCMRRPGNEDGTTGARQAHIPASRSGSSSLRTHVGLAWSKRLDARCVISQMRWCLLPIDHVLDEWYVKYNKAYSLSRTTCVCICVGFHLSPPGLRGVQVGKEVLGCLTWYLQTELCFFEGEDAIRVKRRLPQDSRKRTMEPGVQGSGFEVYNWIPARPLPWVLPEVLTRVRLPAWRLVGMVPLVKVVTPDLCSVNTFTPSVVARTQTSLREVLG